MLKFTTSQQHMIDIASERIVRPFEVDIIKVHDFGSGVTTALRHIQKNCNDGTARNIWVEATRPWDTVMNLCKVTEILTGHHNHGCGYLDTIWRTFRALSENGKRPLILWLDECRLMKPLDREMLICLMEHTAAHLDVNVRAVFLLGRIKKYNTQLHETEEIFWHSERINNRARRVFEFTKETLDEKVQPRARASA